MAMASPKKFAFVFPAASGHMNPSLAVARPLVEAGHEVHYLALPVMRGLIEGAGAKYHSVEEYLTELMPNPELGLFGNLMNLFEEHGLERSLLKGFEFMRNVVLEKKMPGTLRFFGSVGPDAVVYCPVVNREAAAAAKVFGVPSISLNTIAGPGAFATNFFAQRQACREDTEEFISRVNAFEPEFVATRRLNAEFGLCLRPGIELPIGKEDTFALAALNLVTTSDDLMDPMSPEMARSYAAEGTTFVGVGPLLDREGTERAAGHKLHGSGGLPQDSGSGEAILAEVRAARAAGRRVVMVSMGTVITGDMPELGWEGRKVGCDGQPRGLTGRELCRGAWAGAFDAFGVPAGAGAEAAPLLVVALGPQAEPLGDIVAPANAICAPALPQVDLLRIGVNLFLTHGGQNSFTESLSYGTPVVICPGAGDQIVNAAKAVALGVGLKVDRPDPVAGAEREAVEAYRAEVSSALRQVWGRPDVTAAARACAERLCTAGGVPRATELILAAATTGAAEGGLCGKESRAPPSGVLYGPAPVAGA